MQNLYLWPDPSGFRLYLWPDSSGFRLSTCDMIQADADSLLVTWSKWMQTIYLRPDPGGCRRSLGPDSGECRLSTCDLIQEDADSLLVTWSRRMQTLYLWLDPNGCRLSTCDLIQADADSLLVTWSKWMQTIYLWPDPSGCRFYLWPDPAGCRLSTCDLIQVDADLWVDPTRWQSPHRCAGSCPCEGLGVVRKLRLGTTAVRVWSLDRSVAVCGGAPSMQKCLATPEVFYFVMVILKHGAGHVALRVSFSVRNYALILTFTVLSTPFRLPLPAFILQTLCWVLEKPLC